MVIYPLTLPVQGILAPLCTRQNKEKFQASVVSQLNRGFFPPYYFNTAYKGDTFRKRVSGSTDRLFFHHTFEAWGIINAIIIRSRMSKYH